MFLWTYTLNAKFRDQSRGPTGLHSEMSPGLEITVRACYMLCISLALHILPGTNIWLTLNKVLDIFPSVDTGKPQQQAGAQVIKCWFNWIASKCTRRLTSSLLCGEFCVFFIQQKIHCKTPALHFLFQNSCDKTKLGISPNEFQYKIKVCNLICDMQQKPYIQNLGSPLQLWNIMGWQSKPKKPVASF